MRKETDKAQYDDGDNSRKISQSEAIDNIGGCAGLASFR
jgi:hypothetical protein